MTFKLTQLTKLLRFKKKPKENLTLLFGKRGMTKFAKRHGKLIATTNLVGTRVVTRKGRLYLKS
tara:strand:+ start:72 stop:263 length:192 start_codon:yes stop_codon:yes gene_type:complete